MKTETIPDKIYLHETTKLVDSWYLNPSKLCHNHEYVRKDTLLKWAQNMKHICKSSEPVEKVFQIIIDKLNSM